MTPRLLSTAILPGCWRRTDWNPRPGVSYSPAERARTAPSKISFAGSAAQRNKAQRHTHAADFIPSYYMTRALPGHPAPGVTIGANMKFVLVKTPGRPGK